MNIHLKFQNNVNRKALIDTGDCANAMPVDFYEKLKKNCPISKSFLLQATVLIVKVGSGKNIKVLGQIDIALKFNDHEFKNNFLFLSSRINVVLGNTFFQNSSIEINPSDKLLTLLEMTYQLNEIECRKEG